jgi:hypothetical protein
MSKYYAYTLIGIAVLVGVFYWCQIRPANIRSNCVSISRSAGELQGWSKTEMESNYELCVHQEGLAY